MKKIIYLLNAVILIIASNVYAMEYEPGSYLGGQIGGGLIDEGSGYRQVFNASQLGTFTGMGWRAYVGYSFIPFFSIEGGYSDYPDNNYTGTPGSINVRTYIIDLVGKIILPLGKIAEPLSHFSIYGKGGAAYSSTKIDINVTAPSTINESNSSITIRPTYGAGIIFNFTDNIAADASWMSVLGRNYINNSNNIGSQNPVPRCNLFTFGLSYKITGIF